MVFIITMENIKVKLQQFKNVYDTKNTYYAEDNDNFIKKISVKVVLTYTAEIVALNNKNSLFPGESTELYLRLKNMKGLLNAQVHWKVDTQSAINFEYNNSYQESTYENGKENVEAREKMAYASNIAGMAFANALKIASIL